ncbi:MAG: acyl carrier protein [Candidatus Thiodiazotropha sp.]
MLESDIEQIVIACIRENMELSGEVVPIITMNTNPANELSGFDSLRTLEVLIGIEERLECELPPDKVFSGMSYEDITVSSLVSAIQKIKQERMS